MDRYTLKLNVKPEIESNEDEKIARAKRKQLEHDDLGEVIIGGRDSHPKFSLRSDNDDNS
ncbi:MAG: hypothetical protein MRY21_04175 [Simkaniaceae bacterium]|nr:hypothetical protein [Simkaniaceae bacterium]